MAKKTASPSISHLAAVAAAALLCGSGRTTYAGETQAAEMQAIEQIGRYCSKSWKTAHIPQEEWDDNTQQVLTELLERIPRERLSSAIHKSESQERRELNRSIWRIAKRCVRRQRHCSLGDYDAAFDDQANSDVDAQIEQVLSVAQTKLSARQNEIIGMLRQGYDVREIAKAMKLSPARVSNEKHRAIKRIRGFLIDVA